MSFKILKKFAKRDIKKLVPDLHTELHKGQNGNIAVIGGSLEYTGAPYFSAISTMKLGGDLAHVFCCREAGTAIKCYSPDLIVHPILDDPNALVQIKEWLPRFHAVVVGPGLGRDPNTIQLCLEILITLKEMNKITVLDADGLFAILSQPDIMKNFTNLFITPNIVEFNRIYTCLSGQEDYTCIADVYKYLGKQLEGVTIIHKGQHDNIFNGETGCIVDEIGAKKRCGGQGDILSGAVALYAYWTTLQKKDKDDVHYSLLAAYAGCTMTRRLANFAWKQEDRCMTTTDIIKNVRSVMYMFFNS